MAEKSRVAVSVRVRPSKTQDNIWVNVVDGTTLTTVNYRNQLESLQYKFTHAFGPDASQSDVYEGCVKPLITHTLCGKNASVFAYGPTGAGKTHTILGDAEYPGIIPRCIRDLLAAVSSTESQANATEWKYTTSYSYLEIYNEKVQDLLNTGSTDLPIREGAHKTIFVAGLTEQQFSTVDEFNFTFGPASKNRTTAVTKLNERSSRSHSVLMLRVTKRQQTAPHKMFKGKMYIIDLAGSEDNRRTGNKGVRLKESGAINSSLLALGQVVEALHRGQTCIPYRGSKLTRLLQDSLGGSAQTNMIVNLAPEERHYSDTHATLLFARKTKKIVNNVTVNESCARGLKRSHSDGSVNRKTQRLHSHGSNTSAGSIPCSPPLTDSPCTPAKVVKMVHNPPQQQLLSPLIRGQVALKEEMQMKIDLLEAKLDELKSLKEEKQTVTPHLPQSTITPPATDVLPPSAHTTPLQPLVNDMPPPQTPQSPPSDSQLTIDRERTRKPLKLNKENSRKRLGSHAMETTKKSKYTVFADGSITNSYNSPSVVPPTPEFRNPALLKRKRTKISTAAPLKMCNVIDQNEKDTTDAGSVKQESHNNSVLQTLNTGAVKDLQKLQTVGSKRAHLIYDYRELNGNFHTFDDLVNVPGLTHKYLSKFLKANLVQITS